MFIFLNFLNQIIWPNKWIKRQKPKLNRFESSKSLWEKIIIGVCNYLKTGVRAISILLHGKAADEFSLVHVPALVRLLLPVSGQGQGLQLLPGCRHALRLPLAHHSVVHSLTCEKKLKSKKNVQMGDLRLKFHYVPGLGNRLGGDGGGSLWHEVSNCTKYFSRSVNSLGRLL